MYKLTAERLVNKHERNTSQLPRENCIVKNVELQTFLWRPVLERDLRVGDGGPGADLLFPEDGAELGPGRRPPALLTLRGDQLADQQQPAPA